MEISFRFLAEIIQKHWPIVLILRCSEWVCACDTVCTVNTLLQSPTYYSPSLGFTKTYQNHGLQSQFGARKILKILAPGGAKIALNLHQNTEYNLKNFHALHVRFIIYFVVSGIHVTFSASPAYVNIGISAKRTGSWIPCFCASPCLRCFKAPRKRCRSERRKN